MKEENQLIDKVAKEEKGCLATAGKIGVAIVGILESAAALIVIYQFLTGTQSIHIQIPRISASSMPSITLPTIVFSAPTLFEISWAILITFIEFVVYYYTYVALVGDEYGDEGFSVTFSKTLDISAAFIANIVCSWILGTFFHPSDGWPTVLFVFAVFVGGTMAWIPLLVIGSGIFGPKKPSKSRHFSDLF